MGLDMFAFTTADTPASPVDFKDESQEQLHYWRKHPNLHGWMENLYREKGGANADFNCDKLLLTADDLDRLEADIRAKRLPETSGFFFGQTDGSEIDDDLEFIAKARKAISDGLYVFYTSWW